MAGGGVVLAFAISLLGTLFKTPKIPLPFEKLTSTPWMLVFFGLIAIVFAPIFEELFFRGFIQPLLSRTLGTVAGIFVDGGALRSAARSRVFLGMAYTRIHFGGRN